MTHVVLRTFEYTTFFFRRINGDLALIPMSSTLYESLNLLDNSPNVKDDMMSKIMNDWQQLIHNEVCLDLYHWQDYQYPCPVSLKFDMCST